MILGLIRTLSSSGGSIVTAATVSALLTAATVIPMSVAAMDDSPDLDDQIVLDDLEFPPPASMPPGPDSQLALPSDAPERPTPGSPVAPSTETPTQTPRILEFTITTPTPIPTSPPAPSVPQPAAEPTSPPESPRPSPTPVPDTTAEPKPTPTPGSPPTPTPPLPTPTPPVGADLAVGLDEIEQAQNGQRGHAEIRVANVASGTATGVTLTVTIDGGSLRTVDGAGWSCAGGGSTWICQLPSLSGGEATTGTVVFNLGEGSARAITAVVAHDGVDPDPGNNAASAVVAADD